MPRQCRMVPTPNPGDDERGAGAPAPPQDVHDGASAALDVLVAEDDPASRRALCCAVTSLGHRCRTVASGEQAIEAQRGLPADVIISDWSMPGMDGMELFRRIRAMQDGGYTYLLFTSGHARAPDLVEALRAGADDALAKPIDLDELEARLIVAGRVVRACRRLTERNLTLRRDSQASFLAARVDPLTQIGNRLGLEEDLAEVQRSLEAGAEAVTLAMCDVDGFKRYNDRFGHLAGDHALQRVAHGLRASLRKGDRVYRYGGEEFVVILPGEAPRDALAAMDRARAAVEGLAIEHAPGARNPMLTVSVGLARADLGVRSVQAALADADHAMYRAKAAGGNTVVGNLELH